MNPSSTEYSDSIEELEKRLLENEYEPRQFSENDIEIACAGIKATQYGLQDTEKDIVGMVQYDTGRFMTVVNTFYPSLPLAFKTAQECYSIDSEYLRIRSLSSLVREHGPAMRLALGTTGFLGRLYLNSELGEHYQFSNELLTPRTMCYKYVE